MQQLLCSQSLCQGVCTHHKLLSLYRFLRYKIGMGMEQYQTGPGVKVFKIIQYQTTMSMEQSNLILYYLIYYCIDYTDNFTISCGPRYLRLSKITAAKLIQNERKIVQMDKKCTHSIHEQTGHGEINVVHWCI